MAVTPDKPGFVSRQWRSVMQRGIDTVSEYADVAAQKLSAVSDPRARLLRKRRWALRLGIFFSFATVFWVAVTGLLATWSTPVWGLIITGVIAAGAAVPATLFLLRYRWLRGEPLPPTRQVSGRRLPPHGSVARPSMSALGASERGFHSLLGVMQRGNMLPPEEIRELVAAADRTAATMAATADEVVSMERAAIETPHSQSYLAPTINAFTAQLSTGVRQYNEMVTAAAQLVSAANTGAMSSSPMSQQRYRNELAGATDRLMGWAQAFDELGQLRRA
ncbi:phage shock envelope stress response protein PspM [Mycolicibacterium psychrotolerans]|uniref:phage shock envelope stress response protein PspM n=1 Tax=Mycolicibacterium psychrotolerans TaxID=216929 RepID=UPI003D676075